MFTKFSLPLSFPFPLLIQKWIQSPFCRAWTKWEGWTNVKKLKFYTLWNFLKDINFKVFSISHPPPSVPASVCPSVWLWGCLLGGAEVSHSSSRVSGTWGKGQRGIVNKEKAHQKHKNASCFNRPVQAQIALFFIS